MFSISSLMFFVIFYSMHNLVFRKWYLFVSECWKVFLMKMSTVLEFMCVILNQQHWCLNLVDRILATISSLSLSQTHIVMLIQSKRETEKDIISFTWGIEDLFFFFFNFLFFADHPLKMDKIVKMRRTSEDI